MAAHKCPQNVRYFKLLSSVRLARQSRMSWRWEGEFWEQNDPYGDRFSKPVPCSCCAGFVLVPATLLYVLITRDRAAIPFVIVMTLLFWGVAELARRKADQMDFRRS